MKNALCILWYYRAITQCVIYIELIFKDFLFADESGKRVALEMTGQYRSVCRLIVGRIKVKSYVHRSIDRCKIAYS